MTLQTVCAPLDPRWWDAAASRTLEWAGACGLPPRDLRALTVLVPRASDGPWLRTALHRGLGGASVVVAPRIATLEQWVGVAPGPQTHRLVELFDALRASDWARETFGDRPAGLWALAGELAGLGDELTLAAVGSDDSFEGRWRDSVARHFQRRAAAAAGAQSQLVLQLWRAHASEQFGSGALLRQWARRARTAGGPLVFLAPFGLAAWQQVLLEALARTQPVCAVLGDLRAALATHGWLAATWPELIEPQQKPAPIADRGENARAQRAPSLRVLPARSLEEEAVAACLQVEQWLRRGVGPVALIALDRLTARRVRALLERGRIVVADQAGWKLSTTSAAAAVMRWLELVSADFRIRDLLDWLRSSFAFSGKPDRLALARLIDRVARADALAGGLPAINRALARLLPTEVPHSGLVAAQDALARLAEQARLLRAAGTLERLSAALDASLDALGMREPLARDPVGRDVLRELGNLAAGLAGHRGRGSLVEFRELLAWHFETTNAADPSVESPVVMSSLAGACLRDFEAAILIGVDAQHLPSGAEPSVLMSAAVRRDLGLDTLADRHRTQAIELATLMCSVPRVAATWRVRDGDEPRALSPWLDRLREMAGRAGWPDPVRPVELPRQTVAARRPQRPAPGAPRRVPGRLSASACQSLVDCPYQFYGRYLLGLGRRELASDAVDKRDLGTALHSILYRLHRQADANALDRMPDPELQQAASQIAREVFGPELRDRPTLLAYRRRVLDLIPAYVAWLRSRTTEGWRLQSAEIAFGLPLPLEGGRTVELVGRADRVDVHRDGEHEAIDYKARSHAAVRKAAADPGEDIQLALYGLGLGPRVTRASFLSFERAGEPDRDAKPAVLQVAAAQPFRRWVDAVEQRLRSDLARVQAGASLPALGVEPTCSRCDMRGLCRRAEWGAASQADE